MDDPPIIVAEVSKNWPGSKLPTLSQCFEKVISVNRERGYRLKDWRFSQVMPARGKMVETIIAVFETEGRPMGILPKKRN